MVPASARAKRVHALDRSAGVTGLELLIEYKMSSWHEIDTLAFIRNIFPSVLWLASQEYNYIFNK
jgi:hypothetical protein